MLSGGSSQLHRSGLKPDLHPREGCGSGKERYSCVYSKIVIKSLQRHLSPD